MCVCVSVPRVGAATTWRRLLAWGAAATARPLTALVRRVSRAIEWRPHAVVARGQPGLFSALLAGRACWPGGRTRRVLVAALLGGAFDAEVAAAPARTQAVARALGWRPLGARG